MAPKTRSPAGLLVTLLLLTALAPVATVQAAPTEASEYYYGVEYDWTSLDSDLQNVTGLDIQELFTEIMADADSAGFNLDLGQLTTGATNVYVHQTEDITPQVFQNINGEDVRLEPKQRRRSPPRTAVQRRDHDRLVRNHVRFSDHRL